MKRSVLSTLKTAFKHLFLGGMRSCFFVLLVVIITSSTVGLAFLSQLTANLPSIEGIDSLTTQTSTKLYDKTGTILLYEYGDIRREQVALADVPQYFIDATLSIEDWEFYQHQGFSVRGISRSIRSLIIEHKIIGGGSTITQQLIKNTLLSNERTFDRKIKEIVLAVQLEQQRTKQEILELYLNTAPYGGLVYGCATAARYYFSKDIKELTLAEMAFLAGLPQAPTLYSPSRNAYETTTDEVVGWIKDAEKTYVDEDQKTLQEKEDSILIKSWKKRQIKVLLDMVAYGYITEEEAMQAIQQPLTFQTPTTQKLAPHFVDYVQEYLTRKIAHDQFGDDQEQADHYIAQNGLTIITSLDMQLQERAEKLLQDNRGRLAAIRASNAAMTVLDAKSGEILAMQGSIAYYDKKIDGQVNVITSPYRQPGSSMKPLIYAAALEKGYTPAEVFNDKQYIFSDGYKPRNYDYRFHGIVNMRTALANSYNVPAVLMIQKLGVGKTMEFLHTVGITTLWDEKNYGLSLPLGGADVKMLDLAYGFTALANQGILAGEDALIPSNRVASNYRKTDPVSILKIIDHEEKTIYEYSARGNQVITPATAFILSDMLSDNIARTPAFGAVNPLNLGKGVAVKTGTDSELKDIVTIGYTPSYVVAVWAGNNDRRKAVSSSGVNGAAPIWNTYMRTLLTTPREEFEKPDNVVGVRWGNSTEYFVVGTRPDRFPSLSSQFLPTGTPALIPPIVEPTLNPSWYIFTPFITQAPPKDTPIPKPSTVNTIPIPKPTSVKVQTKSP